MFNNILVNFPTNLGDAVLALPVLDRLKATYPTAKITIVVSPQTETFFSKNNSIDRIILFNKLWPMGKKAAFALELRNKFEIVVDLKNSFLPVVLRPKIRTRFFREFPPNMHAKDKYLSLISAFTQGEGKRSDFILTEAESAKWKDFKPSVFVACSSRSVIKQYPYRFLREAVSILKNNYRLAILGIKNDREFYRDILTMEGVVDLVGKTEAFEVFYLLRKYGRLVLAVDSSILHMASYLSIPTVALFGPTDPAKFGPYSDKRIILQRQGVSCLACSKASCDTDHICMDIKPERVVEAVKRLC